MSKPKTLLESFAQLGAVTALEKAKELDQLKPQIEELEENLQRSVVNSIKACLDVEHAAKAAESMIAACFARLKARAA